MWRNINIKELRQILDDYKLGPMSRADDILRWLAKERIEWRISQGYDLKMNYGRIWCTIGNVDEGISASADDIFDAILDAAALLLAYLAD